MKIIYYFFGIILIVAGLFFGYYKFTNNVFDYNTIQKTTPQESSVSVEETSTPNRSDTGVSNKSEDYSNLIWSDEAHDLAGNSYPLCYNLSNSCQKENEDLRIRSGLLNGQGAVEYCNNLNENGVVGWRLPTKEELIYTYNKLAAKSKFQDDFGNPPGTEIQNFRRYNRYRSSTPTGNTYNQHFIVNFSGGKVQEANDYIADHVRCVKT